MLLESVDLVMGRDFHEDFSTKRVRSYDSDYRSLPEPLMPGGTINVSWGAQAFKGGYIQLQLAVAVDGRWSPWFDIAQWTESNTRNVVRTSFSERSASFGEIDVDTYINTLDRPVTGWRVYTSCYDRSDLFWLTVQAADKQRWSRVSEPYLPEPVRLDVPVVSQYSIRGGKIHCGPVSAHGILTGFGVTHDPGAAGVREVIRGTVDKAYVGGNWAFLAAHMSAKLRPIGKRAFIQNVSSVRDIELYLQDGYPAIASLKWNNRSSDKTLHLPGGIPKTDGHLLVVVGVDGPWVLAMDPATTRRDHSDVFRRYPREAFERRLIASANGTIIAVSELP